MVSFIRITSVIVATLALLIGFFYRPDWVVKERSDTIWLLSLLFTGIALTIALWYGKPRPKADAKPEQKLAHNVQRIMSLMIVGFVLLSLQLLRYQVAAAGDLQKPYYNANNELIQDPRLVRGELSIQRGRIFDTYANPVVGIQVSPDGLVKRTYLNQFITPLVGYYSPLQFGNSGLEDSYDDYLTGRNGTNPFLTAQRDLLHLPLRGNDLYLTIEPNLQKLAVETLGNLAGSVVLMDAQTGAILAMVGNPTFNPADIAFDPTQDENKWSDQFSAIQKRWQELNARSGSPLLPKATQGLYVPGSIFKTFSLSTALDAGKVTPETVFTDTGTLLVDGFTFRGDNRPDKNKSNWTVQQCYMFSLNSCFAQVGLTIGTEDFVRYGDKFGFGQKIPFDVPVEPSRLFVTPNNLNRRIALAETAFGQGQLQITPMQLVLMVAAIGRGDGVIPRPYMVKEIRTPEKALVKETKPQAWLSPILPATAQTARSIMIASATDGYVGLNGGGLKDTGAVVGGKTGTAEAGNGLFNANYIAWASKGGRTFAIAVIVEKLPDGEGLKYALPRANTILRAALAQVK